MPPPPPPPPPPPSFPPPPAPTVRRFPLVRGGRWKEVN
eukprot:COSAG03_NODE_1114_length_4788_cov_9.163574_1_plen_37_part_10